MKENFQITAQEDGQKYWISRSIATVCFIFRLNFPFVEVLTEVRGKGIDHSGERCVPCGYLAWDETLEECMQREIMEEVGMTIDPTQLQHIRTNSNPSENRQNVSIHYLYFAKNDEEINLDARFGGEKDEIEKVEWLPICNMLDSRSHFLKTIPNDFCFNHRERILEYLPIMLKQICQYENEKDEEG